MVSVVVRARDAASDLRRCLGALPGLEIVVVDNESTDDSRIVAEQAGATVVTISQSEFSWGRALNRGIAASHGEIILILSADATPQEDFLKYMLFPFADKNMGIVYGRQIPYPDAPIDERARLAATFGDWSEELDPETHKDNPAARGMIASNACAAIRRELWEQCPYDEETSGGEEGPFTCYALQHGYRVRYEPRAIVQHSHRDSAWRRACRDWEILHKSCVYTGQRVTAWKVIRWWAAVVKRRLRNLLWTEADLWCQWEGFWRLPVDLAAYMIVGVSMYHGGKRERYWR